MTRREKIKQSLLAKMPRDAINQFLSRDKTLQLPFSFFLVLWGYLLA